MSQTLVLRRGNFFRKYTIVTKYSDGSYDKDPEHFFTWRGALAKAGYCSVKQEIYVWNRLHGNWYYVFTINK